MFDKIAQYYRKGETAKGIKLLKKVLLKMARNDRLQSETSKKSLKKTTKNSKK